MKNLKKRRDENKKFLQSQHMLFFSHSSIQIYVNNLKKVAVTGKKSLDLFPDDEKIMSEILYPIVRYI